MSVWNNIQRVRPETNSYAMVGKQLWLLGIKGVVKGIHNYVKPVDNVEDYIDREVYYETLYDHIDPNNTEATVESAFAAFNTAKNNTSNDPLVITKSIQAPTADDRPWWKKVLNIDAPSNTSKNVAVTENI